MRSINSRMGYVSCRNLSKVNSRCRHLSCICDLRAVVPHGRFNEGTRLPGSRLRIVTTMNLYVATRVGLVGLVSFLCSGCCHYPKSSISKPSNPAGSPERTIEIVAYGDTRTGPFGLGDNESQAIHGLVVDDIFKNTATIDAALFTGDAVMSNFELWKKRYWRCFLTQCNRFEHAQIPFYPSLGNHEMLPAVLPAIKIASADRLGMPGLVVGNQSGTPAEMVRFYDAGEEANVDIASLPLSETQQVIDSSVAAGRNELKQI